MVDFSQMNKKQLEQEIQHRAQALYQAYLQAENIAKNAQQEVNTERAKLLQTLGAERQAALALAKTKYDQAIERFQKDQNAFRNLLKLADSAWDNPAWNTWDPSLGTDLPYSLRIGQFNYSGRWNNFTTPALLPMIGAGKNLLFLASGSGKAVARQAIQSIALRMLATVPAGKLRMLCIDPVGLGETVAGFIQDLPDSITGGRSWSEPGHIDQQLANLEQDMANIKQKFLGKRYATIEDYNQEAGMVEEPYRLLIVSDFPARFSDFSAQRLVSIATNGPALGVYLLGMVDTDARLSHDFNLNDLALTAQQITCTPRGNQWLHPVFQKCQLSLDNPPPAKDFIHIVQAVGQAAQKAQKVEVPFANVSATPDGWWAGDASREVSFPIGQLGAKKSQLMNLNSETEAHALIIGKIGFGKSNLLQVIIDSIITHYAPDEVALYLIDMKQVTFEVYAANHTPHARVVAIKADPEFAISVLRRIDQEHADRKNLLIGKGLNLESYRNLTGKKLPRLFLIIDEFQDLFYEPAYAQEASDILERLVRQGRSFGIHLILASQTLRGQHTLPTVVKDLIPVRIALQCAEADARELMSDDNTEAFLLERAGEAIYNNKNGQVQGNNRFQVFWMKDDERRKLVASVTTYARQNGIKADPGQIIFDGRDVVSICANADLIRLLADAASQAPRRRGTIIGYLGAPFEIKGHVGPQFLRAAGKNLLIAGGEGSEEPVLSAAASLLISFTAQYPPDGTAIRVINFLELEHAQDYMDQLRQVLPLPIQQIVTQQEAEKAIREAVDELRTRRAADSQYTRTLPDRYLIILGIHRLRKLREDAAAGDEDQSLSEAFLELTQEGPEQGLYSIIWADNLKNLERGVGRSAVDAFDLRAGLQMSANDSINLFDNDKANALGAGRALYINIQSDSRPTKYRPYTLPSRAEIAELLNNRTE